MITIDDPEMPGLSSLSHSELARICGTNSAALKRLRYRAGKRAILHLQTEAGEGAIWFFKGGKAARLARRNKTQSRFDPQTQALFQLFPQDHRMPQIADFLEDYPNLAPDLIGGAPLGPPQLLRYRPGLSCTFFCPSRDGGGAYVKLVNDDDIDRLAEMNARMQAGLRGTAVAISPVLGQSGPHTALAYEAARGVPLDQALRETEGGSPLEQTIAALRAFWALDLTAERSLGHDALIRRARECEIFVAVTVPQAQARVSERVARLQANRPELSLCPIHADVKLEHIFLDGPRVTLIDTESVSMGPPDYDLAQLFGRLLQAEIEGLLPCARVQQAAEVIRAYTGPGFNWCLDIVALRLVKYYAQRPGPQALSRVLALLERLP